MSLVPPKGPARKPVTGRNRSSITGFVPVPWPKSTGLVAFESQHEENLIYVMRDDPDVARLWSQPETFAWRDASTGAPRKYTPDFLVEFADGSHAYREVKPFATLLTEPDFKGRREAIEAHCRDRDARFEVWTEREIGGADPFIRVATATEYRLLGLATEGELTEPDDGLPHASASVARELGIARGMMLEGFWIGRAALTGLVTAVRPKPLPVPRWARSAQ